jgi:hypothetical protein
MGTGRPGLNQSHFPKLKYVTNCDSYSKDVKMDLELDPGIYISNKHPR